MEQTVVTFLGQDARYDVVRGIRLDVAYLLRVEVSEDRSLRNASLEEVERSLTLRGLVESHILTSERCKGDSHFGVLTYESTIEVTEAEERLHLFEIRWYSPFEYCLSLIWVYSYSFRGDDKTEEFSLLSRRTHTC